MPRHKQNKNNIIVLMVSFLSQTNFFLKKNLTTIFQKVEIKWMPITRKIFYHQSMVLVLKLNSLPRNSLLEA